MIERCNPLFAVTQVTRKASNLEDRSGQPDSDVHMHHKSQKKIDVMEDIDSVPSNVQFSHQERFVVCI